MQIVSYLISLGVPLLSIYIIFALDMYGTGKRTIIVSCLLWSAFAAFGLAYITNNALIASGQSFNFVSTRTAPVTEEIFKALVLVFFIQQPSFKYFIDGAIYGFAAGIGFAMSENILYVSNASSDATLTLSVSRVLSATLMHGAASAVFGISLGLSRRVTGILKIMYPFFGLFFAILVHFIYNNLLVELGSGVVLLMTAIGIGVGSGILIIIFVTQGLKGEKRRFNESLGAGSGVSSGERKAVQQLGSESIEDILE